MDDERPGWVDDDFRCVRCERNARLNDDRLCASCVKAERQVGEET